ncbi:glycine betaine ABC transporter substrate-binding protein [Noviherbaspirillum saxi]|uniref:ABC transporter permease subunit n=1 Tax=Noviherbaspirillum saxi TaxID=2320863 RepID=A0A3A3G0X5_9BURK|nr:glycine betaine ABC transporter substrate-binding protein [Noviherbaspirillum saxi]RJG00112.1 ABC transporter permease subunit [Noviherbaspirillum saxi]
MLLASFAAQGADVLRVGSKRFTESYLLGEVIRQTAAPHTQVEHKQGLGNTAIVFEALKSGNIDIYPEYLGTIDQEILKHKSPVSLQEINRELASFGLAAAVPLGFNNSYALAVRGSDRQLGLETLGDLSRHPGLRLGLSHEFIGRADGWAGLAARYGLPHTPTGLDHGLAYQALSARQVDVIDIYATDAKIRQYGLHVLKDDAGYFPRYDALLLYRLDIAQRFPDAWRALQQLQGKISADDMLAMNAGAELEGKPFSEVAAGFLSNGKQQARQAGGVQARLFDGQLWRLTREHLLLVLLSVLSATAIGVPLGILAAYVPRVRHAVMAVVGVLQTVPSLALLAMLIPLLGTIGVVPALIALFLYALLPIVRNTSIGIEQVPGGLRMAALALGMTKRDRLLHVDLPLALPVILAGIKTAAVMSVGTATIAAFIGAGGYGERIATGLAINDNDMLLAGALPAAALALLTQFAFDMLERMLTRYRRMPFDRH